jgi:hypothetical protein
MYCYSDSYLYDFIIHPNNSEIIQKGRERRLQTMNGKRLKEKYKAGSKKRTENRLNGITYPNNHTMCWQIHTPGQG